MVTQQGVTWNISNIDPPKLRIPSRPPHIDRMDRGAGIQWCEGRGKSGGGRGEEGGNFGREILGAGVTPKFVVFYRFYSIFMYFNAVTVYQKYIIDILKQIQVYLQWIRHSPLHRRGVFWQPWFTLNLFTSDFGLSLVDYFPLAGLGGSVGCAVRLETRRSRVQPPRRSATFFRGDWSWNIFYGHSLPSADSRMSVSGERMCTILVNRLED